MTKQHTRVEIDKKTCSRFLTWHVKNIVVRANTYAHYETRLYDHRTIPLEDGQYKGHQPVPDSYVSRDWDAIEVRGTIIHLNDKTQPCSRTTKKKKHKTLEQFNHHTVGNHKIIIWKKIDFLNFILNIILQKQRWKSQKTCISHMASDEYRLTKPWNYAHFWQPIRLM